MSRGAFCCLPAGADFDRGHLAVATESFRLQKHVIVTLLAPSAQEWTKREFSQYVYDEFFEGETRSRQASLSRAYKRLEKRDYLKRSKRGCWELTQRGEEIALLEWKQDRSRYPHVILVTS